jgi:glyoxylase-like metal-dependent hydrolase (beta-lactamase superfamily II)
MIDLRFLGTGGAHDVALGNSAAIIRLNGKRILLDCGFTVYPKLVALRMVDDIDAVLVTHLHDDHVGSLSALLYHRYFMPGSNRLTLLFPDAFGDTLLGWLRYAMATPERFCIPTPLSEWQGITGIDTYGLHFEGMPTYGYLFEDQDDMIAFSGDLYATDFLFDFLTRLPRRPRVVFHDISFYHTPVHAHYTDVAPYLDRFQVVGYHHNPDYAPPDNPIPLAMHQPEYLLSVPA